jgi:hypothetical protein
LRGLVDDRHVFPPFLFFLLRGHGQNTSQTEHFPVCGAGATPRFFWAAKGSQKWGRSSPTRCLARVQIAHSVVGNFFSFGHLLDREGEREGDG